MNIQLDITEAFGTIDYVNAGGLITYIDIALTEQLLAHFNFNLSNFVLNLIDQPIIDAIQKQLPVALTEQFIDEGFLIVTRAALSFDEVKSCESVLSLQLNDKEHDLVRSWGRKLISGDRVYNIGGQLSTFPELRLHLSIVSPKEITLSFSIEDCVYIENYTDFMKNVGHLNQSISPPLPIHNLFNLELRNKHLTPNWDAGFYTFSDDDSQS
ncbi:hypothetical protein [Pseudomonas frederiksbergensis]|uniref:hypothetical protein n=1 Tax=Pseudomonas frederiksbergensis TaxID=104087 RepID=UPI003D204894